MIRYLILAAMILIFAAMLAGCEAAKYEATPPAKQCVCEKCGCIDCLCSDTTYGGLTRSVDEDAGVVRVDITTGKSEVLQADGTWKESDGKVNGVKPDLDLLKRSLEKDAERREREAKYVDEKDLPEDFDHAEFPKIIIDGVKMTYEPNFPPHKPRGAYLSDDFGCEMMWIGLSKDLQLSDFNDFRDSDQSKYGQRDGIYIQNIDGDNRVLHREGRLQIMDGGKWRDVKPGDKLRHSASDQLIRGTSTKIYKQGAVERIGRSEHYAQLGADAWYVAMNPDGGEREARLQYERIRDANLSQNWRD